MATNAERHRPAIEEFAMRDPFDSPRRPGLGFTLNEVLWASPSSAY
jgi:hypothetical protein